MNPTSFISTNDIRLLFTRAMSDMYQQEVPLYKKLLSLATNVNQQVLDNSPELLKKENPILNIEFHGAIRVGSAYELSMVRRLFAVMGMHPVDYYDLSIAGIPVHSTAFRALDKNDLVLCPFRVFCSLLRLDLIENDELRRKANNLLEKRRIFPEELLKLIYLSEKQEGLNLNQTNRFIENALEVFRWHEEATVESFTYDQLKASHGLVADVVSFKGPHINHLTPSVLDIDECQRQFVKNNIKAKAIVEGPPKRACPILLRQTSFIAIAEKVMFSDGESGSHTARFGEVEQRGIALTPKGRKLYDKLLFKAKNGDSKIEYSIRLKEAFKEFPDNYEQIRQQKLAYFYYSESSLSKNLKPKSDDVEYLIDYGFVKVIPIIYEDFLPVSAAGIFTSNLSNNTQSSIYNKTDSYGNNNLRHFEEALGVAVHSSFKLYEKLQQQSLNRALKN